MSDKPQAAPLVERLRELRRSGEFDAARSILVELTGTHPGDVALRALAWEHEAFWWQPLTGPHTRLDRRGEDDLAFVRDCWADVAFMRSFSRMAPPLPEGDEALRTLLRREQAAIVSESRALHWTITSQSRKLGFVSVVDIAMRHRRAEFLIGVRRDGSRWVGPEAAHLVLGFLAEQAGIERLTAHFYVDNHGAIDAAVKLGFVVEGTLRSYLRMADGSRQDLVVAGLVLDRDYFHRHARIRQRLLSRSAAAGSSRA